MEKYSVSAAQTTTPYRFSSVKPVFLKEPQRGFQKSKKNAVKMLWV